MKVNRVRVQNYKPIIDSGWVDVEGGITTLIGGNESGKTSFLEAIRSFGDDEPYSGSEICDQIDSNKSKDELPIVTIEFQMEMEDIETIQESDSDVTNKEFKITKFADGSKIKQDRVFIGEDYKFSKVIEPTLASLKDMTDDFEDLAERMGGQYRQHYSEELQPVLEEIVKSEHEEDDFLDLYNELETALNNIPEDNNEIKNKKEEYLQIWENEEKRIFDKISDFPNLNEYLPNIVYHSEFDLISDEVNESSLDSEEFKTFRNFLEIVGINPDEFSELSPIERRRVTDRAEGEIEGEVNKIWEQKEVEVDLYYENEIFYAQIKDDRIRDDQAVDRELRRPSERSKGFQWFFSFYINLTAQSEKSQDNSLILLDDPAVFLHPQGKRNWLEAIEDLSDGNQIIYSTHSPFLIRKDYPRRIRLVSDQGDLGSKVMSELHKGDSTTLEPLRNALGIGLGDSPFVSKRKILVEGISDYNILIGVANYFRDHLEEDILDWSEVTVMPTNGADQMIQAAKWVASEEFSYALLLDNDEKGKQVQDDISEHHQDVDDDRVFLLHKEEGPPFHLEIEDMFAPEFLIDCVNEAYSEQFDDWSRIDIEEDEDETWLIEGVEYSGRKIMSKLTKIFDERERGDPDKVLIANEIRDRLTSGHNDLESGAESFKHILGKIRNVT
ncbi:MAG: AAA family ATPase [Halodesulfurarchaeum sp.]|nr:AAA family ATPase [Halodesulfurarchaeum sp.]